MKDQKNSLGWKKNNNPSLGATVARLAQHHRLTFHISQNDFSSSHSSVLPVPWSQSWLLIKLLLNMNVYYVYMKTQVIPGVVY